MKAASTAAADAPRLQADWKTAGPVKRNTVDAIWRRFRAACNQVFRAVRTAARHRPRRAGRRA